MIAQSTSNNFLFKTIDFIIRFNCQMYFKNSVHLE